jgi:hypothetical protein
MDVSLWAVLGIVLLLLGVPMVLLLPDTTLAYGFSYLVGAGAAFLMVSAADWLWQSWESHSDRDTNLPDA